MKNKQFRFVNNTAGTITMEVKVYIEKVKN